MSGDTKFWKTFLADKFVGWGSAGRLDDRTAVPVLSGGECHIDSYRLTDIQVTELTAHAAVLTHRIDVNGVCQGKTLVPAYYTATVFVREGKQWRAAFRAQSATVDPMKAVRPAASALWTDGPTLGDADTQSLLGREQLMVSAWKDHDAGRMDKFFGPEMQFIDIFGDQIATRAQALKAWSGEGCDVKSFEFSGAKATMFAPNFGVLTYRASYAAKCFGQDARSGSWVEVSVSIVFSRTQVDFSGKRGMILAVRSDRRSHNPKCDSEGIVELAQLAGR